MALQLSSFTIEQAYGQDQTVSGNLTVTGSANVSTLIASGGSISGAAAGLALGAGGQNQNIALYPSGGGYVQVNGFLGVGASVPHYKISLGTDDDSKLALFENPGGTNMFGFGYRDDGTHIPRTQFFANGAEVMSVLQNGNVGMGTSTPTYRLSIVGATNDGVAISANNPELIFNHLGAATNFARIVANSGVSANYNGMWLASNEKPDGSQANPNLSSWAIDLGGTDMALNDSFNIRRKAPGGSYAMPFVITSAGNVGIGTATPASGLQVFALNDDAAGSVRLGHSGVTDGYLSFGWDQSTSTDAFWISSYDHNAATNRKDFVVIRQDNGNVGIGTANPAARLEVNGDTKLDGNLTVGGSFSAANYLASSGDITGGSTGLTLNSGSADQSVTVISNGAGSVVAERSENATVTAGRVLQSLDLAYKNPTYSVSGVANGKALASIRAVAGTNWTGWNTDEANTDLAFFTSKNGGAGGVPVTAEAMRITFGGNLGVGTSSPGSVINGNSTFFRPDPLGKLVDVYSASSESVINLISNQNTDGAPVGGVYFSRSGGQGDAHFQIGGIQVREVGTGAFAGGDMYLYTKPSGNGELATSPTMVLTNGGSVGIGTTAPSEALEVRHGNFVVRDSTYDGSSQGGGWIKGYDDNHSIYFREGSRNNTDYYEYGGTLASGTGHKFFTGGLKSTQGLRLQIADDGSYFTGNVGIGTAAPSARLNVVGPTVLDAGAPNVSALTLKGDQSAIGHFDSSGTGKWLSGLRSDNGGAVDNFVFWNPNVGYMLALTQSGNVGIGTTNPARLLDLYGTGAWNSTGGIRVQGNNPGFEMADLTSGQRWLIGNGVITGSDGKLGLAYDINHSRHNIVVDTAGNVGVGTMSPSTRLEVNGDTKLDGNLTVSGSFSAPSYVASNGVITGGSSGLALNAGGTNQNVSISPSGSGATVIAGNVGIGVSAPANRLSVFGVASSPPTSGTMPNGILSVSNAANNNLYIGLNGAPGYGAWLQAQDITNLAATYPLLLNPNGGNVGIGTSAPDTALTVKGKVHATEVVVDTTVVANDLKVQPKIWADDVFDDRHTLEPLGQVEKEIKATKHLPGMPSAQEVATHGVSVADMQAKLLGKIEELTLHMIQMEKDNAQLRAEVAALKAAQK